jgi:hypothetical protein
MIRPVGAVAAATTALIALVANPVLGQRPAPASVTFNHGIVIGGEWMQATALPLHRDAMVSLSVDAGLRRGHWAVDAGWLRIARELSTVQGGFVSLGYPLAFGRALFIPSLGAFGGQAQRSVDSTGFDFVGTNGVIGHTPRFSYSKSGSAGGGGGLTLEVPVYRVIALRASVSQWFFSGTPLENDRARTVVGVGGSIRVLGGSR